ncbi:MAG: calcium/sodium antiporter [Proteobacteria bacterium]|nr:calcium/sodium antiporter [Pseudomonadota bacterium]
MSNLLFFFAGLAALGVGAELLVRGASRLSLSFGISPLVVGLTVVAFGTSAPEMAVSVGAALSGKVDVAVGNVVGSNIFNVLFILGASALIVPLAVHAQVVRQEVPIMIGASLLFAALAFDGRIGFPEAALLFAALVAYTAFLVVQSRRESRATADEFAGEMPPPAAWDAHWGVQLLLVLGGLALLVVGAGWLVDAAVAFARAFGVSDLVIGLTIVAAGTSLPEVAASLTAALRGERDIAVGNVVGSNVFNVLGCLGLAGMAAPGGLVVAPELLRVDLWVLLATMLACLPVFAYRHEIRRWQGGLFLLAYVAYTTYLVLHAQRHPLLPGFADAVLFGLLPACALLLFLMWLKRRPGHRPDCGNT